MWTHKPIDSTVSDLGTLPLAIPSNNLQPSSPAPELQTLIEQLPVRLLLDKAHGHSQTLCLKVPVFIIEEELFVSMLRLGYWSVTAWVPRCTEECLRFCSEVTFRKGKRHTICSWGIPVRRCISLKWRSFDPG